MEIGKYLDWHIPGTSVVDFNYRISCTSTNNLNFSGNVSIGTGNFSISTGNISTSIGNIGTSNGILNVTTTAIANLYNYIANFTGAVTYDSRIVMRVGRGTNDVFNLNVGWRNLGSPFGYLCLQGYETTSALRIYIDKIECVGVNLLAPNLKTDNETRLVTAEGDIYDLNIRMNGAESNIDELLDRTTQISYESGVTTLTSSGGNSLNIVNTRSSLSTSMIDCLMPNLLSGQKTKIRLGKTNSANSVVEIEYEHNDTVNERFLSLGFWGNQNLLKMHPDRFVMSKSLTITTNMLNGIIITDSSSNIPFNRFAYIGVTGVLEAGRYLDWHFSATSGDRTGRSQIDAFGNLNHDKLFTAVNITGDNNTRLTTAESDIDNLEERMTTAEGGISSLDGRISTNEEDIISLDGRVTTLEEVGPANHNSLLNIQGGTTNEYYHLTSAKCSDVNNLDFTRLQNISGSVLDTSTTFDGNVLADNVSSDNETRLSHIEDMTLNISSMVYNTSTTFTGNVLASNITSTNKTDIEALQTKTQNISATSGNTEFTGTINGMGLHTTGGTPPAHSYISPVKSDGVMEVGRIIDWHTWGKTPVADSDCRMEWTGSLLSVGGTFRANHYDIASGGTISTSMYEVIRGMIYPVGSVFTNEGGAPSWGQWDYIGRVQTTPSGNYIYYYRRTL